MIMVKLGGGLGNQMFMYALGRHLAIKNNAVLKLDTGAYRLGDYRKYALGCFCIMEDFASMEEVEKLANPEGVKVTRRRGFLEKLLGLTGNLKRSHVYEERSFVYDPNLLELKGDIYLEGLFHDERYFKEIKDVICKDFSFKHQPEGRNKEIADKIEAVNSVSVHVRRTDLVTNKLFFESHGVCSLNYYKFCMEKIFSMTNAPYFFVFSDDIVWARANLRFDAPVMFVDHNNEEHCHEDLRLMSLCNHHIIANSTFSWWGAWLNPNPGKIVLAPGNWIKKVKKKDVMIVPNGWIKIAN